MQSNVSLDSAFNALFMNEFPMEPYTVKSGDDTLEFQRVEKPKMSTMSAMSEFSTFSEAISRYSNWGYADIDFFLKKNGKLVSHFQYDHEKLVLPIFMKSFHKEDVQIKEQQFVFRNSATKLFIPELENIMKNSIKKEFSKFV